MKIESHLGAFTMAFFGVAMTIFLAIVGPTPMCCSFDGNLRRPWAATSTFIAGTEKDLEIRIRRDGDIFVGPNFVRRSQLRSALQEIAARNPQRSVQIHADGAVRYGAIEDVLVAARSAGFAELSLMTFRGTRFEAWQRHGAG